MPSPTSSRLTFETGARLKGGFKGRWAAERVISDTTLSLLKPASYAGTFSRAFVSRLRHRAGVVLGQWQRAGGATSAFSLAAEKEQPTARVPGAGGCIVLFLLRPLNAGRRLFPRKRHADGFGTFAIKSTEKAATMSRVFCTFFPQKGTQKLPGRCLRLLRPV